VLLPAPGRTRRLLQLGRSDRSGRRTALHLRRGCVWAPPRRSPTPESSTAAARNWSTTERRRH